MQIQVDGPTPGTSLVGRQWIERLIHERAPSESAAEDAIECFLEPLRYAVSVKGDALEWWDGDIGTDASALTVLRKYKGVSIERTGLRKAVDFYLTALPWLHHPHIDWLAANLLIFAEVAATAQQWTSPFWLDGEPNWRIGALLTGFFVIKWAVLISLFGAAIVFSDDLPWAPGLVGVWIVVSQVRNFLQRRKRSQILGGMVDAYKAVRSSTLSWKVVWEQLSRTRVAGSYWDPELYALVERRAGVF